MNTPSSIQEQNTLFGHPTGLFTLFFAEMWERFSYYGMRALLVFYMIKGFLGYGDTQAYGIYGAYTALVYMTPFFGGMIADRLLGQRKAVVFGGALMAAGHLLMGVQEGEYLGLFTLSKEMAEMLFFGALALLILGNGFFKPNISTIVGSLYPQGSPKRDGGFTLFYIGINLGAAMAPLLCGYIGETYGWHYGFGLATIGMLIGLAVFILPNLVTQVLILAGAITASWAMTEYLPDDPAAQVLKYFVAGALILAAVIAVMALQRGGAAKRCRPAARPRKTAKKDRAEDPGRVDRLPWNPGARAAFRPLCLRVQAFHQ
jgi:POT family proton-dependent oligopeptide transporter